LFRASATPPPPAICHRRDDPRVVWVADFVRETVRTDDGFFDSKLL
jgi:hypothetical protein